jgi:hypothetical protein
MTSSFKQLTPLSKYLSFVLDNAITLDQYCALDLGMTNTALHHIRIANPDICQDYIDSVLDKCQAKVACGGYLEKRNLYSDNDNFSHDEIQRNIHLGVDFWTIAGTRVLTPLKGKVHSFQNNKAIGDYGPTIILEHEFEKTRFHTLYGHLSLESLENLSIGNIFEAGETIATLGTPDINVNYAAHLHFQIIIDMEGKKGDYPGVCSEDNLDFYSKNCPNPNLLLHIPS